MQYLLTSVDAAALYVTQLTSIVINSFVPQPVFLADFKQIKKIQCLAQSDGKALIQLDIEGARQVSTTTAP